MHKKDQEESSAINAIAFKSMDFNHQLNVPESFVARAGRHVQHIVTSFDNRISRFEPVSTVVEMAGETRLSFSHAQMLGPCNNKEAPPRCDRPRTYIDGSFRGDPLGPHRRVVPPPRSASVVYRVLQLMESQETRNKLSRQTDAHRFEATRGSLVGSGRRGNEKRLPPATPHLRLGLVGRLPSTLNISLYVPYESSLSSSIYNRPSSPITN